MVMTQDYPSKDIILSICIPTYNREQYLRQSLDCLFLQAESYKQYLEILISDNCSTDRTREMVLAKIEDTDLPVRYYQNEKNIGGNNNFAKLVGYSSGQYIYMMGDDDIVSPNFLQIVFNILLDGNDYSLIHWNRMCGNEDCRNSTIVDLDFDSSIWNGTASEFMKKVLHKANFLSSIIFNRECWYLGEQYAIDKYFGYQWFARLYFGALSHNKRCLYYYFPLVIQRNPSKSWFQYWPHYKIGSLSNLFEDLDGSVPGLYAFWRSYLKSSIDDALPVVARYKSYYRKKEIRCILERHLTNTEKWRLYYYLYFPMASTLRKLHIRMKTLFLKVL